LCLWEILFMTVDFNQALKYVCNLIYSLCKSISKSVIEAIL